MSQFLGVPLHNGLALAFQEGKIELEVVFVTPDEDSDDDAQVVVESDDGTE